MSWEPDERVWLVSVLERRTAEGLTMAESLWMSERLVELHAAFSQRPCGREALAGVIGLLHGEQDAGGVLPRPWWPPAVTPARERRCRDRAIARARQVEGATTGEIAGRFQISTRTVQRVLAAERTSG